MTNSAIPGKINNLYSSSITMLADAIAPSTLNTSCGRSTVNTACFTASQFGVAAGGTASPLVQTDFGNMPPDSFYGPAYFDIDTQLMKSFKLGEHATFTLGAQAYNVLNHPNFLNETSTESSAPAVSVTSGSLGKIISTASPPTSIYGSFQGSAVSGRVLVVSGKFNF